LAAVLLISGCVPAGPRALLEGANLLEKGKYAEAARKFRVAAELMPGEGRAWNYLGLAYHRGGQPELALTAYQRALSCHYPSAIPRYNLGCLYLELDKYPAAIEQFTAYLQVDPKSALAWQCLGLAQLRSRQHPSAETSFNQALQLNASLAESWNGLGLLRCYRGYYREATNYFTTAIRYGPKYAEPNLNLAIVYHRYLKNPAAALVCYRRYLALAENAPDRARVQEVAERLDRELNPPALAETVQPLIGATQAISGMKTSLLASPVIRTQLMALWPATSLVDRATSPPALSPKPVEKAIVTEAPKPSTSTSALARVEKPVPVTTNAPATASVVPSAAAATNVVTEIAAPRRDSQELTQDHRQSAMTEVAAPPLIISQPSSEPRTSVTEPAESESEPGRYPYQPQLLLGAGDRAEAEKSYRIALQEHKAGRVLSAIDAYQKAVQSDPSYFEAYHNLGFLAFQSGNLPLSLHAYERALIVQPTSAPTRYNFALALQSAQYLQDAALEMERVIAASPQDSRTHLALANLYAQQLHQPLLARQHYERVLALEPQHPQASAIRRWLAANP